jgi:hypothetical protein
MQTSDLTRVALLDCLSRPWRPTVLLALTVTAAIGVVRLSAADARGNRR